jgi:hypothetical protein
MGNLIQINFKKKKSKRQQMMNRVENDLEQQYCRKLEGPCYCYYCNRRDEIAVKVIAVAIVALVAIGLWISW